MGQNVSTSLTTNVVEAFCGSAGLSRALRACGFAVYPVDFDKNRHASKVHVIDLDLTVQPCVDVFKQMLSDLQPSYIHMGLPCNTCSRAREKPLPKHCKNARGPTPLRDADNLLGRPGLSVNDQAKVQSANQLYHLAIWVLRWCMSSGCMVSIENPHRSWLWPLLALLAMTSSSRFSSTRWMLLSLTLACMVEGVTSVRSGCQRQVSFLLLPRTAINHMHMQAGSLTCPRGDYFSHEGGSCLP